MQSKKLSLVEALFNTFSGFFISLILTYTVLPLFGFNVNFEQSFFITSIFTIVSIFRGYFVRRIFNKLTYYYNFS